MKLKSSYFLKILGLAGLYVIAAMLGLSLAFSVKEITTVWPPSGIALAALVLFGFELWPGIFIGAFLANLWTGEPALVAIGIAVGNTLEAVVGAFLLQQIGAFKPTLHRVRGVIALLGLAAVFSTMIAATLGNVSLLLGGLVSRDALSSSWLLWWFGDMAGVILFAPVCLVWFGSWRQLNKQNLKEFVALILTTTAVSALIFFGHLWIFGSRPQGSYLIFPIIIWAAFRFKQIGTTSVSVIVSILAILGTVAGHGPFALSGTTEQQLTSLLIYVILISTSGLFMSVAVMQRDDYAEQLRIQAQDLERARAKILTELKSTTEHEQRLEKSNDRITKILASLLDESPNRSKRHY